MKIFNISAARPKKFEKQWNLIDEILNGYR